VTSPPWPSTVAFRYEKRLTAVADADDHFVMAQTADRGTHLTLYGAGAAPPGAVQDVIDDAPPGITVTWVEVPYTESELLRTMHEGEKHIPSVTSGTYVHLTYVEIGVWPGSPARLAEVQQFADGLDTPVPIIVVAQPPAYDGMGVHGGSGH